jgi:uncharacterized protein involved in exopolysaccharide biosynthesis
MKESYNLLDVLKTLYKWRKPILYVTVGAAVLSLVISLIIPVYYKSTTTFYAASQDLFKPEKVYGNSNSEMYYYGGGEDIERILTFGQSTELADYLIDQFNLYDHYKIDPESFRAEYKVRKKLFGLFTLIRTKYDALELSVEDTSPPMAANIANEAREKINYDLSQIIKNSQKNVIESFSASIADKELQLKQILDSLTYFQQKYGIYNPDAQTEYLSTRVTSIETDLAQMNARLESFKSIGGSSVRDSIINLTALISGMESESELLTSPESESKYNLKRFNEAKGKIEILNDMYRKATNYINNDKEKLKVYQSGYDLAVSAIHVVEQAEEPLVKSRPKKSFVVISSTLAALLFSILAVMLIEAYKGLNWASVIKPQKD